MTLDKVTLDKVKRKHLTLKGKISPIFEHHVPLAKK